MCNSTARTAALHLRRTQQLNTLTLLTGTQYSCIYKGDGDTVANKESNYLKTVLQ